MYYLLSWRVTLPVSHEQVTLHPDPCLMLWAFTLMLNLLMPNLSSCYQPSYLNAFLRAPYYVLVSLLAQLLITSNPC